MFLLSGLGGSEMIILFLAIGVLLLPAFCLIDIIRSHFADSTNKIIWVLIVLFLPYLGSILYLAIGRSQRVR